jgi:hypothetical protein
MGIGQAVADRMHSGILPKLVLVSSRSLAPNPEIDGHENTRSPTGAAEAKPDDATD